ncbi:hypothetical protein HMPREF2852_06605 [Anaerococcus sp. HMSC065G05]|uniref:hypothetical protein n=1 Tax=Anaerococcus sp. HMSC065G05 TaxID=1739356 RepID=UPI0008A422DE|nr:hypothetical protein [Anaerococcus sp. HMSC065G05]OFJ69698.1 hypothetical protein HMPREF2852_06605 [Anaerococcus sp. HMSC065G05]
MKTKEFIKRVEELGYNVRKVYSQIEIMSQGLTVAKVSTKRMYVIKSFCFVDVEWKNQDKLFDLIIEYAKTPIDEREEEKSKIYMIYDWSSECIKILYKYKTKALAKVAKDALFGDCIDDYKLIEIDLDEVEDD